MSVTIYRSGNTGHWTGRCHSCEAGTYNATGPRVVVIHRRGCPFLLPRRVTNLRWVGRSYIVRGRTRVVVCLWHRGRWAWKLPHRSSSHQYGFRWPGVTMELGRAHLTVSRARCSA